MRSVISILDLSVEELDELIATANDIIADPEKYAHICQGKKLATMFFEPSTRTRLSFEAAMYELGGNVIGFSDAKSTSVSKGETVHDTMKVISCFSDIIAVRHPKEGAAYVAARSCDIPVVNAGDGGHHHPTQTLTDLLTIRREKGRLDSIKIGFCGDLKFGRTVHSLIEALLRYENVEYWLISPEELVLPDYVRDQMKAAGVKFHEIRSMEDALPELDVLYMTRVQKERFFNEEDYIRLKNTYILDEEKLSAASQDMIVMHPLPRVNEIEIDVDDDPRAVYFKQVRNGKDVRKALILTLLGWKED